jgi:hypothetical protein
LLGSGGSPWHADFDLNQSVIIIVINCESLAWDAGEKPYSLFLIPLDGASHPKHSQKEPGASRVEESVNPSQSPIDSLLQGLSFLPSLLNGRNLSSSAGAGKSWPKLLRTGPSC